LTIPAALSTVSTALYHRVMRELLNILDAAAALESSGESFALATVVATSGSTYRSPGAHQLVTAGSSVGTVSGGCLDSQVRATAAEVMASGVPRLETYDLTKDDDLVWGWGLGCSGITEVLFEPASSAIALTSAMRSAIAKETDVAIVTLLEGELGSRMMISSGSTTGSLGHLDEAATAAIGAGITGPADLNGTRAFVEVVAPPNRLVVVGANNDARPLVEVAASLGWNTVVVDPRPRLLTTERFPQAQLLVTAEPAELTDVLAVDGRTFVMLMNHNFLRDGDALVSLIGSETAYLGLLGPAERAIQLLKYAAEQGAHVSAADQAKLHGPAGLDIGADGPLEIAWSIMAEMLAVDRGRHGGSLRDR